MNHQLNNHYLREGAKVTTKATPVKQPNYRNFATSLEITLQELVKGNLEQKGVSSTRIKGIFEGF